MNVQLNLTFLQAFENRLNESTPSDWQEAFRYDASFTSRTKEEFAVEHISSFVELGGWAVTPYTWKVACNMLLDYADLSAEEKPVKNKLHEATKNLILANLNLVEALLSNKLSYYDFKRVFSIFGEIREELRNLDK